MVRVTEIGGKAADALARARGTARVLAVLSGSVYLVADGQIVWLGGPGSTLHPRAMLAPAPAAVVGDALRVDATHARSWRPPPLALGPSSADSIAAGCRRLRGSLSAVGAPDGLAVLLGDLAPEGRATPTSPEGRRGSRSIHAELLERAAPGVHALAAACAAGDAPSAAEAALGLLGLGPGLTPAGDDFVGGAFFARALLTAAGTGDREAWRASAIALRSRAGALTHPISAALLGDLLEGESHAPIHDLARGLAAGSRWPDVLDAARRLTRIGHSSGWDILGGFIAGVLGP